MPRRIIQRLRRILAAYLLACYGVAWASLVATGPDLLALPWLQSFVGVGVAWIGGLAATLGRMVDASYDDKPFHHHREFMRDGSVSAVIGLAGYWGGMSQAVGPATLALVLLLGGYAGTRTLSTWVGKVIGPKPQT